MTPAARVQAAIEILDEVIASARDDGPPADTIVTRYFKTRRYAGSKDRRAVRELVSGRSGAVAERPRQRPGGALALPESDPRCSTCSASRAGPRPWATKRRWRNAGRSQLAGAELSPLVDLRRWPALLERAPLDLRVNVARVSRDELLPQFAGAEPTPLSPWGLRLPPTAASTTIRRSLRAWSKCRTKAAS